MIFDLASRILSCHCCHSCIRLPLGLKGLEHRIKDSFGLAMAVEHQKVVDSFAGPTEICAKQYHFCAILFTETGCLEHDRQVRDAGEYRSISETQAVWTIEARPTSTPLEECKVSLGIAELPWLDGVYAQGGECFKRSVSVIFPGGF